MRTLFLIRHGKSSWEEPELADQARPLTPRGRRNARRMARRLARREVAPELILSSPATRALATARIFAKKLRYKKKRIIVDERLYPGRPAAMLELVRALDDGIRCVLLFGHNPALLELAQRLSKSIERMPTASVAEFAVDAKSWSELGKARLRRVAIDYPKRARRDP